MDLQQYPVHKMKVVSCSEDLAHSQELQVPTGLLAQYFRDQAPQTLSHWNPAYQEETSQQPKPLSPQVLSPAS